VTHPRDPREAPTDRTERRDLSRGWLPVGVVASLLAAVAAGVWWLAADHAALQTLQRVQADQATALAHQAEVIQTVERGQASIEATLRAVQAELQRNSALLEDLRRRP